MSNKPDPQVLADLQALIDEGPVVKKSRIEITLEPYHDLILGLHANGQPFQVIHDRLTKRGTVKVSLEAVRRYVVTNTTETKTAPTPAKRKKRT